MQTSVLWSIVPWPSARLYWELGKSSHELASKQVYATGCSPTSLTVPMKFLATLILIANCAGEIWMHSEILSQLASVYQSSPRQAHSPRLWVLTSLYFIESNWLSLMKFLLQSSKGKQKKHWLTSIVLSEVMATYWSRCLFSAEKLMKLNPLKGCCDHNFPTSLFLEFELLPPSLFINVPSLG